MNEVYDKTKPDSKSEEPRDGNDVLTEAGRRFQRERSRNAVRQERERTMKGQGVYVCMKWAKRWDFVVAGYLGYFLSYTGTQADPEGYIYKSAQEIKSESGITPDQQERCRKLLDSEGVIHAQKRGGIGNKWHVMVNLPFLKMWDELPTFEEAKEAVIASMEEESSQGSPDNEPEVHSPENPDNSQDNPDNSQGFPETHNRNTQETRRNNPPAEAVETSGRVAACLEVLGEVENLKKDRKNLASTLEKLIPEYPHLDPVLVCKQVRDDAATYTIDSPPGFLRHKFKKAEEKRASEPRHPQSDPRERLSREERARLDEEWRENDELLAELMAKVKTKPNRADWYVSMYGVGFEAVDGLISEGLGHEDIQARLRAGKYEEVA